MYHCSLADAWSFWENTKYWHCHLTKWLRKARWILIAAHSSLLTASFPLTSMLPFDCEIPSFWNPSIRLTWSPASSSSKTPLLRSCSPFRMPVFSIVGSGSGTGLVVVKLSKLPCRIALADFFFMAITQQWNSYQKNKHEKGLKAENTRGSFFYIPPHSASPSHKQEE